MTDQSPAIAPVKNKAPAIARAIAILRLLGRIEAALGVQAIARELGLVPSTCLYVLRALVEEQLVAFDPQTKLYRLDAGVLSLARGWLRQDRFVDIVQLELNALSRQSGITTMAVQIVGLDHIIVVATAQGGTSFQLSAQVGSRFPALISATGRCIAAFGDHPPAWLENRFAKLRWDNPPTFEEWIVQVDTAKVRGYATDEGYYMAGVTVLAAPVRSGSGYPTHALVAIGIGSAIRSRGIDSIGEDLRQSSDRLSSLLA